MVEGSVEGSVEGKECYVTFDTGSDITTARPDLVHSSSVDWNPEAEWMCTVTGERAPIRDKANNAIGNRRLKDATEHDHCRPQG